VGADDDDDGEETIPYMEPKPGGKAWRFVTNPDKLASPQVSAALTALVDKYGSLKAALAAGSNPKFSRRVERRTMHYRAEVRLREPRVENARAVG